MDFILEEKYKNILIVILSIVILLLTIFLFLFKSKEECKVEEKGTDLILEKEVITDEMNEEEYVVDIKGAVKKSGVYRVKKGTIVDDVIKLAGLKSNASTSYINLSYELKNHDVIYIYTKTEVKNKNIKESCNCNNVDISDCVDSGIVSNGEGSVTNISGKVNINTASLEELLSLDGVGESKALAIIEYRNTNKFNNIEDIKNVSGIGESVYNKIKDSITV